MAKVVLWTVKMYVTIFFYKLQYKSFDYVLRTSFSIQKSADLHSFWWHHASLHSLHHQPWWGLYLNKSISAVHQDATLKVPEPYETGLSPPGPGKTLITMKASTPFSELVAYYRFSPFSSFCCHHKITVIDIFVIRHVPLPALKLLMYFAVQDKILQRFSLECCNRRKHTLLRNKWKWKGSGWKNHPEKSG